jgi:hypothetical protein
MRGEHVTVRYKGHPEGVNFLVDLLRTHGLKVSHDLLLRLPLQGQQWMMHRDIVQAYGTLLEVHGRSDTRSAVQAVVDEFRTRYEAGADISVDE